ncbi:putative uncharacterized protein DDB_G0282133 [Anthonomus grandis grandis]|uniref:putative uncharacterized protein DDB_G0282133 n=1 Tax=Anthonomus grandis grandis TaxID=2921223 RepID=UPI002166BA2C|nr:putative uncharacterized protein DDB_G0282133 [Anthonomus grandis grandis]
MSADRVVPKAPGAKPPPPVPPRPSRSLIKEALAKTRQTYQEIGTVGLSSPHRKSEKPTAKQRPQLSTDQPRENNNNNNNDNRVNANRYCGEERPVVYQSENCKKRTSPEQKNLQRVDSLCRVDEQDRIKTRPSAVQVQRSDSNRSNKLHRVESHHRQRIPPNITEETDNLPVLNRKIREGPPSVSIQRRLSFKSVQDNDEKSKNADHKMGKVDRDGVPEEQETRQRSNDDDNNAKRSTDEDLSSNISITSSSSEENEPQTNEHRLNNRNHVNTLIDEMFASVLEVNLSSSSESIITDTDNKIKISNIGNTPPSKNSSSDNLTVIVINDSASESNTSTSERKVTFNDRQNHEFLISELQHMRECDEDKKLKRQRSSPLNHRLYDEERRSSQDCDKIQTNDWYGVNDGKKVRMSSCHIKIDEPLMDNDERFKDMTLKYGLPPLPKALAGFNFQDPIRSEKVDNVTEDYSNERKEDRKEGSSLDKQLAILKREMDCLREQDLSLLSKLWFLNESIREFKQILQEPDEKTFLRLTPSPTPSSIDDEEFYVISTC